jgi:hypothetical protein
MWLQSVFNAISEVEMKKPGAVNRVAQFNPDEEWTPEQWEDYNLVAAAIVEPFAFPGGESEDEEFYYQKSEEEGFSFVKGQLTDVPNSESWKKVCDLIDVMGY